MMLIKPLLFEAVAPDRVGLVQESMRARGGLAKLVDLRRTIGHGVQHPSEDARKQRTTAGGRIEAAVAALKSDDQRAFTEISMAAYNAACEAERLCLTSKAAGYHLLAAAASRAASMVAQPSCSPVLQSAQLGHKSATYLKPVTSIPAATSPGRSLGVYTMRDFGLVGLVPGFQSPLLP